MLTLLSIRNFAVVSSLDLELRAGMTVVSGETGAGKSIMLDALGLALGNRAESDSVRQGAQRAEISALFDLSNLPQARAWLAENELEGEEGECILRRTLSQDGRSRSFINGYPCPLARVRELGELLVDIHGQHEHQRLLKRDHHRTLLDDYASAQTLAQEVKKRYQTWRERTDELERLRQLTTEANAERQLLSYQVDEINQLEPQAGELEQLEEEQRQLSHAESILHRGQQITEILGEGDADHACALLTQAIHLLNQMESQSDALSQTGEMLNSALIQIEEAQRELAHFLNRVELNPERLSEVEERLTQLYDLARKHRVAPESLPELHEQLNRQLDLLTHADEDLEQLEQSVAAAHQDLLEAAEQLSQLRTENAKQLAQAVNDQLNELGMSRAQFDIEIRTAAADQVTAYGLEEVEFVIATNPGQSPKPLARIASGGELSRISLAIQVVTAQLTSTPTLIFDEVDVGIGGAIAEVVGRLLRQLGRNAQVLCVTHQPQVAAQGDQHLFVSKGLDLNKAETRITQLTREQRVNEVARMLGGLEITEATLTHAAEMLAEE